MKFATPEGLHRAATEEVRKLLASKPTRPWQAPKSAASGVVFELDSTFELAAMQTSFGNAFPGLPEARASSVQRRVRIHSAGGYRSNESVEKASPSRVLEHSDHGAVYLDLKDGSFLHFGNEQLPATPILCSTRKLTLDWRVDRKPGEITLSVRGALSLDLRIELGADKPISREVAEAVLHSCLPGLELLVAVGLPLDELVEEGVPVCVEMWAADAKGVRRACLARHRVTIRSIGDVPPSVFAIPKGFRDLRAKAEKQDAGWVTLGKYSRRARHTTRARGTAHAANRAYVHAQTMATYGPGVFDRKPEIQSEPFLPQCQPQTLHASASFEIRQSLLDAIQAILNAIGSRLDVASGARVDPTDPENRAVRFEIDWLDQLERFSDNTPPNADFEAGDGLFCFLREPPTSADGLGGGRGLLDRMAESLAKELLSLPNPLPLGGQENPVILPAAIENEIAAVAANANIARNRRFEELDPTSRARVREEVLSQRISTLQETINGDFGESIWPSPSFDLIHVRLQLESLRAEFAANRDLLSGLRITLIDGNANRPMIEFEFALRRFEATLTMERWPGVHFWATAAGTLVALAIVGPLVVGPLIMLLMGLGPLGWLTLSLLIANAPVATVLGGAALLAVVTYLVWDTSELRLTIDQPRLRSSVAPDRRSNPGGLFLDADRASLDGDVTVSVNSQIPSGVHQLFDTIANFAIEAFENQVRAVLEEGVVDGLEQAMQRFPHFRLPLPFDAQVDVSIGIPVVGDVLAEEGVPRHELLQYAADGRTEQRLAASTLTGISYPFTGFAHVVTQVDPDLRGYVSEALQRRLAAGETPRLGYGISQNLLNANIYALWLGNRYAVDYDAEHAQDALTVIAGAVPNQGQLQGPFTAHAWAASSPQVHVAPRSYLESAERSYLLTCWPDIRLCLGVMLGKPATLELRFAVHSIAHIGFGSVSELGRLSFFSLENDFLHVLFDDRDKYLKLSLEPPLPLGGPGHPVNPIALQGIEVRGAGFDPVAALGPAQRLALLEAVQPLMREAARRLLRIDGVRGLTFVPGSDRVDQQLYDGVVQVDIEPHRTSLVALVASHGSITYVLPSRDANDQLVPANIDFDLKSCADGADMRDLLG
ncbi:hypothetical protein I1E95_06650 [Synechococcus sp. CBW1107]|uniref:hypothetical protein n=1 Tax=Synechococcus sp. CBW1107 TaxID=2789857 RepID=UPI0018CF074A|nr:hypothetical protein [Synechococcus sp. CBW1107]QPN57743.1 hypothetical protein I1E95_06650 [Synechococcus sp. CBW1107]